MSRFLVPKGEPTFGIGICARCFRKMPLAHLRSDPNILGLMVCEKDADEYDPYRLGLVPVDDLRLPFVRPDVPLTFQQLGIITEDGNYFILTEDMTKAITP